MAAASAIAPDLWDMAGILQLPATGLVAPASGSGGLTGAAPGDGRYTRDIGRLRVLPDAYSSIGSGPAPRLGNGRPRPQPIRRWDIQRRRGSLVEGGTALGERWSRGRGRVPATSRPNGIAEQAAVSSCAGGSSQGAVMA